MRKMLAFVLVILILFGCGCDRPDVVVVTATPPIDPPPLTQPVRPSPTVDSDEDWDGDDGDNQQTREPSTRIPPTYVPPVEVTKVPTIPPTLEPSPTQETVYFRAVNPNSNLDWIDEVSNYATNCGDVIYEAPQSWMPVVLGNSKCPDSYAKYEDGVRTGVNYIAGEWGFQGAFPVECAYRRCALQMILTPSLNGAPYTFGFLEVYAVLVFEDGSEWVLRAQSFEYAHRTSTFFYVLEGEGFPPTEVRFMVKLRYASWFSESYVWFHELAVIYVPPTWGDDYVCNWTLKECG
jgi:hypothetical protein